MTLKLKPEYVGVTVTKNVFAVGMVTFDALKVPQDHYINYYKLGFDFIFIVVKQKESDPEKISIDGVEVTKKKKSTK